MLKIPIVWHLQDLVSNRYFGLYISFLNYLANRVADYIICDGQIIKEALIKEYGPRSVGDYYGLTPQDQRQKNKDAFQNDSKVRFFV